MLEFTASIVIGTQFVVQNHKHVIEIKEDASTIVFPSIYIYNGRTIRFISAMSIALRTFNYNNIAIECVNKAYNSPG